MGVYVVMDENGGAQLFPPDITTPSRTHVVLRPDPGGLPQLIWSGVLTPSGADAGAVAAALGAASGSLDAYPGRPEWGRAGVQLLNEHYQYQFTRPALRGHRADGTGWSTRFAVTGTEESGSRLTIEAADPAAGLGLRTELESTEGGALRARHTLTNRGASPYLLEGLEVLFPLADHLTEILDFTGRHERERVPQRHQLTDGLWLREGRRGKTGVDAASVVAAGEPGFSFDAGDVVALHVGWSGNCVVRVERDGSSRATVGGGELLLPGEVTLEAGESYTTPWVYLVASRHGLDDIGHAFHAWLRAQEAHPTHQPVTLNSWEAMYFDLDRRHLSELVSRAAAVGVERFVLDDGWFHRRRDSTAGLGDWWVDPDVWPDGLGPLVEEVRGRGMEFGLWFEPEMINPASDMFEQHPDWVLSAGDHLPGLQRSQYVVDLTKPEAFRHVRDAVSAVLSAHEISYVKWDHNRDLLEGGSDGRPAIHAQTVAFYALLDDLRARHPDVAWESCASGGGRIDLGVLARSERVWTSDNTDPHSRQSIQRWMSLLVAPEYLGAHVSAPESHQTSRISTLDFRAATALFGAFGIEWDLTAAGPAELERLAWWVGEYKRFRPLLHSGRTVHPASSDPSVLLYGVVAEDGGQALMALAQLDESVSLRGVTMRIPHLIADQAYELSWEGLGPGGVVEEPAKYRLGEQGPTAGETVTGSVLADVGIWLPRRRPQTVTLVHVRARS